MRVLGLVALAVLALDQASKWLVVWRLGLADRGVVEVWPPFLVLRMAWNRGVNFGLLAQDGAAARWILVAVAVAVSAAVAVWMARGGQPRAARVAAGLLIGGAAGNVIDRLLYGAVADFLNMSCCGIENPYAFNVADIAVFAGAAGLALFAADGRPRRGGGGGIGRRGRRKTP